MPPKNEPPKEVPAELDPSNTVELPDEVRDMQQLAKEVPPTCAECAKKDAEIKGLIVERDHFLTTCRKYEEVALGAARTLTGAFGSFHKK